MRTPRPSVTLISVLPGQNYQETLPWINSRPPSSGRLDGLPVNLKEWLFRARQLLRLSYYSSRHSDVGGPYLVGMNLLKGLDLIGQDYKFNPLEKDLTSDVGVLSGIDALRWAITAKRQGRIHLLVAGPNMVVTPLEADRILCSPEIDLVVTPSKWVSSLYLTVAPELDGRLTQWAAGVDTDYWDAPARSERNQWLIYDKTRAGGGQITEVVEHELRSRNFRYQKITYGKYTREEYHRALSRSKGMIVITPTESQGLAQFEAWASDVPTLVWDKHEWEYLDLHFKNPVVSSSPYLSAECGVRFEGIADFGKSFDEFSNSISTFSPRKYVLRHFTLKKAARTYMKLFTG